MATSILGSDVDQSFAEASVPAISWPEAPDTLKLAEGHVHVFGAALPEFRSQCARVEKLLLSRAEIERAGRFQFKEDRNSYVIRHALLRLILGRFLSVAPREIEFDYGEFGKPVLKFPAPSVHFNQSHSSDLALFVVTTHSPIGVDVERVRAIPEFEDIAAQYFCPAETAMMRSLAEERRMKAFYSCWTSKEAHLKATGEGIGASLNQVEVALDSSLQGQSLHLPGDDSDCAWELRTFSPADGYLGALAIKGRVSSLRLWRVPGSLVSLL
jgi:4'-phosphopantetheinyl transferase